MKKMRSLNKKENKVESLGVKFDSLNSCMCDHDACDAKCSCDGNPENYGNNAWDKSGAVDDAVLKVPPEL